MQTDSPSRRRVRFSYVRDRGSDVGDAAGDPSPPNRRRPKGRLYARACKLVRSPPAGSRLAMARRLDATRRRGAARRLEGRHSPVAIPRLAAARRLVAAPLRAAVRRWAANLCRSQRPVGFGTPAGRSVSIDCSVSDGRNAPPAPARRLAAARRLIATELRPCALFAASNSSFRTRPAHRAWSHKFRPAPFAVSYKKQCARTQFRCKDFPRLHWFDACDGDCDGCQGCRRSVLPP